jgi:hypothetical protein
MTEDFSTWNAARTSHAPQASLKHTSYMPEIEAGYTSVQLVVGYALHLAA